MTPERFLEVADLFPEPALLIEPGGTIFASNRAAISVGWSPSSLSGRRLAEVTSAPSEQVADYLRSCLRSSGPVPAMLEILRPDGRPAPCRCHGTRVAGEGEGPRVVLRFTVSANSPSHFAVLDQKIAQLTEEIRRRQVAEARLHEQTQWLQVTLASIGDAILTTDSAGRVTFLNPMAETLTGWSLSEARGRDLADVFPIVHEETGLPVPSPVERVSSERAVVGLRNHTLLVRRDGRETPIDDSAAPIRNADGEVAGVVLVFRDITERKLAEAAIRESEERFRGLMEQSPFSVQVLAPDGYTLRVNRAWEDLFGTSFDQLGDYNVLRDPQLAAAGVSPYLERAFAGEPVAIPAISYDPDETLPGRSRHADSRRWLSAVAYPLRGSAGEIREVVLVHDDITARRRAEDALEESEQRFRLLADTIPQLAWMARPDGDIFWYNRRWYAYTGTTEEAMTGWGWQSVHAPDTLPEVVERWKASLATGEPFDMVFPLRGADGRFRPFLTRVNPLRHTDGRILYWFGTNTEISEQKRAEDASHFLADASAALAAIRDYPSTLQTVANLAVPRFGDSCTIHLVEADGSLTLVAHRDCRTVRGPSAQRLSGPSRVALSGESELVAETGEDRHGTSSYLCVPMRARDRVLGVITFVAGESDRGYGAGDLKLAEGLADRAAVAIENTRLYAELVEADRRKDEFLATLAHELRNPLAPLRNSLEILGMPGAGRDTVDRMRAMMERQVQHLVRLVDDLLDVSRVMRGKVELRRQRVDLATVVSHAVETAQPVIDTHRHELTLSLPDRGIEVEGDAVRLTQVVANLLTNAAKYTMAGGRIRLSLANDEAGGAAVIRVRDDGIGIPHPMLDKVFDLFVQVDSSVARSGGGLGIGLTLVRSLVSLHGGTTQARSDGPGTGSEFVVTLPVAGGDVEARAAPRVDVDGERRALPRRRLLVVDDNVDAAESLAVLLRLGGNEVVVAHDGPTALRLVREQRPEIVLLDLGMPLMDGYQVAQHLRQEDADGSLLVALTGWGQEEDRRRSAEAGFDLHLVKPVEPGMLERLLAHPRLPPGSM